MFFLCVCFFFIFSDFFNCVSFLPPDPRTDRALFLSGFGGPQMCTFGLSCGCWDSGCPTRKNVFFFRALHFLEPTKVATRGLTCLHTHEGGSSRSFCVVLQVELGNSWTSQQDGSSSPRPKAETWTAASANVPVLEIVPPTHPHHRGVAV